MAKLSALSDAELVDLLRLDDGAVLGEIYKRYNRILYTFLYKFLKSLELTEDLIQEIFIKLWDGRGQLSQLLSLRSFLFTIGRLLYLINLGFVIILFLRR